MLKRIFGRTAYYFFSGYYTKVQRFRSRIERILSEQGSEMDRRGCIHGTDKASLFMSKEENLCIGHDYLRHYEILFKSFRTEKFSLLELGCLNGDSLRLWEEYFPEAEIYGVDIDEKTAKNTRGRIHVVIGDATSQETYGKIKSLIENAFIIIDDASHAWSDQRISFELFWDMLSPGGFYVVEDLICGTNGTYPSGISPKVLDSQPFFEYMQDRCEFLRWFDKLEAENLSYHFDHLPPKTQKIESEMDFCMFIPGAVIVRKKA